MVEKYKIWDRKGKRFIDIDNEDYEGYSNIAMCPNTGDVMGYSVSTGELDTECFRDLIAIEYTGFSDNANNEPIFLGSIVKIKGHPKQAINGAYAVMRDHKSKRILAGKKELYSILSYATVIGNIQEDSHSINFNWNEEVNPLQKYDNKKD